MAYRPNRRTALKLLAAGTATAMPGLRAARGQVLDKFVFQTNWVAEAEYGGWYQAAATGIYRRYGIDCEVRPSGPQMNVQQLLLAGRVDGSIGSSYSGLTYVRENLPGVVIAAFFQKDPQILLAHPNVGNDSLEQLKGKTILVSAGGRTSYWPFLKAKYGYADEQARSYTFSMQPYLVNPQLIQQGFLTSEPYSARQAGINPVVHLIADAGYDNYQQTVDVKRELVDQKPDLLQRFVDATIEGWNDYLYGDPGPANALIRKLNPEMSDGLIAFAIEQMKSRELVDFGDTKQLGLGAMTDARWERFYRQTAQWNLNPPDLDYRRAYTLRFVNKRFGIKP